MIANIIKWIFFPWIYISFVMFFVFLCFPQNRYWNFHKGGSQPFKNDFMNFIIGFGVIGYIVAWWFVLVGGTEKILGIIVPFSWGWIDELGSRFSYREVIAFYVGTALTFVVVTSIHKVARINSLVEQLEILAMHENYYLDKKKRFKEIRHSLNKLQLTRCDMDKYLDLVEKAEKRGQ